MQVSRRRFEELVSEALDTIPDELAVLVDNCAVVVEDRPTEEQLRAVSPEGRAESPEEGEQLFGIYEGVDLTSRSPLDYSGVLPDRIVIFMGPHLEVSETEDDLFDEILTTVVHEIAHHFGIDDDRLHDLGWA